MAKLKSVLGYTAAGLSFLVMLATFPSISVLGEPLILSTGLTLAPNYTGGEVVQTIDHGTYQTQVHRLVFDDTLIGERREGFVQLDWGPLGALPTYIDQEIDADGDGQADFRIEVDTMQKQGTVEPYATWVLELEGVYRLKEVLMVRVRLRNPSR